MNNTLGEINIRLENKIEKIGEVLQAPARINAVGGLSSLIGDF